MQKSFFTQITGSLILLIYIGSDVIHHLLLYIGWTIGRVIDLGAMDAYRVDDHLGVGTYLFRLTSRPRIIM